MSLHICLQYFYKGDNRATIYINSTNRDNIIDEIEIFQKARWLSAPEAVQRLFEFEMNDMYPEIINLHLHLPNQQLVSYPEDIDLNEILNSKKAKRTMLTNFFNTCSIDEEVTGLLYRKFPENYMLNQISIPACGIFKPFSNQSL